MVWILPTMSRPAQCNDVLQSIGPVSKGIVFINGTSHLKEYEATLKLPEGWTVLCVADNLGCIGALNLCFKLFPDEFWYGFWADDEFATSKPDNWEQKLIDAAGNFGISFGMDDIHKGKRLQGSVVWGGDLMRAVGYWGVPETFHNFGLDSAWEWLCSPYTVFGGCNAAKITNVPDIMIEHKRWGFSGIEKDQCASLAESIFDEDRKRFVDWQRGDMRMAAERIREARNATHVK